MKKLLILIGLAFALSCEQEQTFCDNPVIESDYQEMLMRANLGGQCGYDYCFYVYLLDVGQKALLLTNDDHGFPLDLGGNQIVHKSTYRENEGLLIKP